MIFMVLGLKGSGQVEGREAGKPGNPEAEARPLLPPINLKKLAYIEMILNNKEHLKITTPIMV